MYQQVHMQKHTQIPSEGEVKGSLMSHAVSYIFYDVYDYISLCSALNRFPHNVLYV